MIGTSMLYCALWALWLSAAAWGIERVMLKGRGPVRAVWICSIALSVLGPMLGYGLSRRAAVPVAPAMSVLSSATSQSMASVGNAVTHRVVQSRSVAARVAVLRAAVVRADRPLGIAWLALSLVLLVYIAGGLVHLSFVRRRWRAGVVNGTRVMISDNSGPALVGVVRSTIVIPEWALALEPDALSLMLRHELEHQSAGDTRMLAAAEMLLMLMPWSPMLWWQLRRLRLAIELDCDARVLRAVPDVRSYGRLLLEFGRQRREMHFAGAALADHAANLEVRIRRMTRRPAIGRGKAVLLSCIAGVVAIVVGCQLPAPTPPAPAPKANAPAVAVAEQSRDSAMFADASKYDRLRTLFDSSSARDRVRVDEMDAQRLLDRLRQDTTQTYMDFKIPKSASGVPVLQQYFEFKVEKNRLERLLGDAMNDSLRSINDKLLGIERGLDSIGRDGRSRMADSLRDTALRFYRDGRPIVGDSLYFLSDSAAADQLSPGCTSSADPAGSAVVKLLVPNGAAARPGRITFTSANATEVGTQLDFDTPGMLCRNAGSGELRLFGQGAFAGTPIVVRTSTPISVVVVTGSGRLLAGPIVVQNESRHFELTWVPR